MELKTTTFKEAEMVISARKRTYFLCAGHRGRGTGAHGYFDEADEAIVLRDLIADFMTACGCVVVKDNDKADLNTVANTINAKADVNDICLDIHFNAAGTAQANGTEVLIQTNFTTKEKLLAYSVQNAICRTLGTYDRGVKTEAKSQYKTLKMCSGIKCNSVLLEVCFCTNQRDAGVYNQYKKELAAAIAKAAMTYL